MAIRLTEKQFIDGLKLVHGDKYDYSLVKYVNNRTAIKIICSMHGVFEQIASSHKRGYNCPKCANIDKGLLKISPQEYVIKKFKEKHGDKYDYSNVKYINSFTKVEIICPTHGSFLQIPSRHSDGNGCPKCVWHKNFTKDIAISQFNKKHNNKYDYSLVEYNTSFKKIKIICPVNNHGIFEMTPNSHTIGSGCPKCGGNYRLNTKELIEEFKIIHGEKYNYSLVNYKSAHEKINIICNTHGKFLQTPNSHKLGSGCPNCIGRNKTTKEFITESKLIHGDKYNYSLVEYIDSNIKVRIICSTHGEFSKKPTNHLSGSGCPVCKESKGERIIRILLKNNDIEFIQQHPFNNCRNINVLPFDFYLIKHNTCIEFQGRQHYEPVKCFGGVKQFKQQIKHDKIKMEYCRDNNIPLIVIKHDENIEEKLKEFLS